MGIIETTQMGIIETTQMGIIDIPKKVESYIYETNETNYETNENFVKEKAGAWSMIVNLRI